MLKDAITNPLFTIRRGRWNREWFLDLSLMAPAALRENMERRWGPGWVMQHHELNELVGQKRLNDGNSAFFRDHAMLERLMREFRSIDLTVAGHRCLVDWWNELPLEERISIARSEKAALMTAEQTASLITKGITNATREVKAVGDRLRARAATSRDAEWERWALTVLGEFFPRFRPPWIPQWELDRS